MKRRPPRRGIETALLRREQALRSLRLHFAEYVADNLDAPVRQAHAESVVNSLRFHIQTCEALIKDIRLYNPRRYDPKTRTFVPLDAKGLAERRRVGEAVSRAHATYRTKMKSRREKNG